MRDAEAVPRPVPRSHRRHLSELACALCALLACSAAPEAAEPPATDPAEHPELAPPEAPLAEPPTTTTTGAPASTPVGVAADRAAPRALLAPSEGPAPRGPMVSVECRGGGARASWQRYGTLGVEQAVVAISAAGPRSWRYLFRYDEDEAVAHAGLRVKGWKFVGDGKTRDALLLREYDYASKRLACTARKAEADRDGLEAALEAAPTETIGCGDAKRIRRIGDDARLPPEGDDAPGWLSSLCDDDPVRAISL